MGEEIENFVENTDSTNNTIIIQDNNGKSIEIENFGINTVVEMNMLKSVW